jgi:hypothetical protein
MLKRLAATAALGCCALVLAASAVAKGNSAPEVYVLNTPGAVQKLQVLSRHRSRVRFVLDMAQPCRRVVSGTAVSLGGDLEEDEDETGLSYGAEEFWYKGADGEQVSLRIDADKFENAIIHDVDEKSGKCVFSDQLMKRVHPAR